MGKDHWFLGSPLEGAVTPCRGWIRIPTSSVKRGNPYVGFWSKKIMRSLIQNFEPKDLKRKSTLRCFFFLNLPHLSINHLSIYLSTYLSIDLSIYLCIYLSIYLFIYLCIYLLSIYLSNIYIYRYLDLGSISLCVCLSLYLSIYLSMQWSLCRISRSKLHRGSAWIKQPQFTCQWSSRSPVAEEFTSKIGDKNGTSMVPSSSNNGENIGYHRGPKNILAATRCATR